MGLMGAYVDVAIEHLANVEAEPFFEVEIGHLLGKASVVVKEETIDPQSGVYAALAMFDDDKD
jgi:hypothetical protein